MFLKNCVYKKSVFYFGQTALPNIFLSVVTVSGSRCNLLSSWQFNSKHGDRC